jgi:hypothetical protein
MPGDENPIAHNPHFQISPASLAQLDLFLKDSGGRMSVTIES